MPADNPSPRPEVIHCACTNLKIASRRVGRVYDAALASLTLNSIQYSILVNIGRRDRVLTIALAELLGMERTTLYRAVAILERRGLVRSEPVGKGRTLQLQLTNAGRALATQAKEAWQGVQNRFVRQFGIGRWAKFLNELHEAEAMITYERCISKSLKASNREYLEFRE